MTTEGPQLATLLRWLGETPPPMRADGDAALSRVSVRAVVHDLCETLLAGSGAETDAAMSSVADLLDAMDPIPGDAVTANRLAWTLRFCWLLWNPGVRAQGSEAVALRRLFAQEVAELAAIVPVAQLELDADRREELVRRGLRAVGLRPGGETAAQAKERLRQVDSVEAHRLIKAAEDRERRARQVREELARKAAAEAAAKISRE